MQGMRSFYVVKCDERGLDLMEFLSNEAIFQLASDRGFVVWQHKGLNLLIAAYKIANTAAYLQATGRLRMKFEARDAIVLPPDIAEALLGE